MYSIWTILFANISVFYELQNREKETEKEAIAPATHSDTWCCWLLFFTYSFRFFQSRRVVTINQNATPSISTESLAIAKMGKQKQTNKHTKRGKKTGEKNSDKMKQKRKETNESDKESERMTDKCE